MMAFMANQIVRIVPKIVTEIRTSDTPNSPVDSKVETRKPVSFNHKHFSSCNPKPFTANDGVIAMLEWFDSIEVTFINSECLEELKTCSATGVFQAPELSNGEQVKGVFVLTKLLMPYLGRKLRH
ncbi:hypothetical protein HanRHA438_Chr13g0589831 [Helianthus annuus]|nr:hypothetical protein HanRHA438_Chr13g0589831 [Helianthus annuus]